MYAQQPPKNPTLAAILSFLINGLGQIYNGEIGKGIIIIVVQIVNALLMMVIIGFITLPIVWIWSIYDAYQVAQRINEKAMQQTIQDTKQCPQCAERVQVGAKVCRHCGYQFVPAAASLAAPPAAQPMTPPLAPAARPGPVAAQARFCPQCGQAVRAGARFCMNCGYAFEQPSGLSMNGHAPEETVNTAPPTT